jgi:GAF domain-containing protein
VGNRIRDLFDAQVVGIATFDHEKQTEQIQYLIEKGERYYPAPLPLNILRKHLIQTKEKILINKNFEEVAATFGVKKLPGTELPKSALYVPLVIGDKVTGYTSLQNIDRENAFSESDVRLLETLANTMGVALENARLFDETTRLSKKRSSKKPSWASLTVSRKASLKNWTCRQFMISWATVSRNYLMPRPLSLPLLIMMPLQRVSST